MKLHIVTPLIESMTLSRHLEVPVFLKMEALQPSGSFKNRGMGNICSSYAQRAFKGLVSSSGGNAGLAVAYSGRKLGLRVNVIVPETTNALMMEKIRLEGAHVTVHGKSWDEADIKAREMASQEGLGYVSPFDDPLIWEGNATLVEELVQSGCRPGAIVLSVGGGGLLCGVVQGLHKAGWHDVPVIAVETEGAASFHAAIQAGKLVTLDKIDTLATSLGAKRVAQAAFDWSKKHRIISQLVSDQQAVKACLKFADEQRVLVEPACGAALAVAYDKLPVLKGYSSILVVVCGGNGVSLKLLDQWSKTLKI